MLDGFRFTTRLPFLSRRGSKEPVPAANASKNRAARFRQEKPPPANLFGRQNFEATGAKGRWATTARKSERLWSLALWAAAEGGGKEGAASG